MNRLRTLGLLVGTLTLGVASTLVVQRVRAAGIPAAEALTYTGYLESQDGTPVTTEQMIGLAVHDSATAESKVCEVPAKAITPIGGRFQIQLPVACVAKISANPELWVEVYVGAIGLGRTKLGAVPYAVEAQHAVEAGHAVSAESAITAATASAANSASGPLAASIAALAARSELPVITPWTSYTPTLTNAGGDPPTASSTGQWRRAGDTIEVNIFTDVKGCTGTGQVRWSLPPGIIAESAKLSTSFPVVGSGFVNWPGSAAKLKPFSVVAQLGQGYVVPEDYDVAGGMQCGPLTLNSTEPNIRMHFALPVQGWTVNGP